MARPAKPRKTLASDLLVALAVALARVAPPADDGTTWPSTRWQNDPVGFARHHFGIELCDYQCEIVEGVRDNRRVAVASGRKIGKSLIAAVLALWFYCSFEDARVFITASTAKQVNKIIWREVRHLHDLNAKRAAEGVCARIDGTPAVLAATGLVARDGREIVGFANATREDAAGISGANLLYIFDEASGIEDMIFEAAEGNQAGAGGLHRTFMISNPTQCEGEFYRAFHERKGQYWTRQISSRQSPNYRFPDRPVVRGLASREFVDDMVAMYGEHSPFVAIHVEGKFVEGEEGRCLTLHDILQSQGRHPDTEGKGHLVIGVDPAGQGVGGDEWAFAPRRGPKLLEIFGVAGLAPAAGLAQISTMIERWAPDPSEMVTIVLDREGSVGAEVFGLLREVANRPGARFRVIGVRSSDRASRQPMVYERTRDELWAAAVDWIKREGGAIPEHGKLARDLHAPSWLGTARNRLVVTDKADLRKLLGRSPDYGDALCLACWVQGDEPVDQRPKNRTPENVRPVGVADPYAGAAFDPYGGNDNGGVGLKFAA